MTDAEIRGWLLKHFHGLRDANGGWVPTDEMILSPNRISRQAVANACEHLKKAEYIEWEPFNPPINKHSIGRAKITGPGIDVVTGAREPSIDIRFPDSGVGISNAGRNERFEMWERLGLDRIKADLMTGGHQVVGGPPQIRDLAWEWVRIKESGISQNLEYTLEAAHAVYGAIQELVAQGARAYSHSVPSAAEARLFAKAGGRLTRVEAKQQVKAAIVGLTNEGKIEAHVEPHLDWSIKRDLPSESVTMSTAKKNKSIRRTWSRRGTA